jgi:hypothetical protein
MVRLRLWRLRQLGSLWMCTDNILTEIHKILKSFINKVNYKQKIYIKGVSYSISFCLNDVYVSLPNLEINS